MSDPALNYPSGYLTNVALYCDECSDLKYVRWRLRRMGLEVFGVIGAMISQAPGDLTPLKLYQV